MTAATASAPPAPAAPRPKRAGWLPLAAPRRLLRLELRRNAMLWMVPVAAALFWFEAYRSSMAMPPLWNMRAMTMQHGALLAFAAPVAGAAAWMGSRDSRRHVTDLIAATARPRWARQITVWTATTCWALVAYLGCIAVLYAAIGRQAAWGGPLWWPAAVGAAGIPALCAVGFVAGTLLPSRFTMPLVTVAAFFALGLSDPLAHGGKSFGQISPIIAGAVDVGPDPGVATFYHYLPDLSMAQVMFLAGLTVTALGILGLPGDAGGRRLRRCAAALTAAGLMAAVTAFALVSTARLDAHGMMIIPALHNAASDRPVRYTPVCSHTAIPVCLNPAYAAYLPAVTAALGPVLSEVAGLAGAPARVSQAAPTYQQASGNGIIVSAGGLSVRVSPSGRGSQRVLLVLPDQLPNQQQQPAMTTAGFAAQVRLDAAPEIVANVIMRRQPHSLAGRDGTPHGSPAQQAVTTALLKDAGALLSGPVQLSGPVPPGAATPAAGNAVPEPAPGTPVYAAAQRFAALPAAARHAWLARHLAALRAGRTTLAQLP